jgi:hypothetical protein
MLRFSRRGFLGSSIAAVISSPELNAKSVVTCSSPSLPALRVHAGGHMLETVEGTAFFWLGDTAWELIHSTTREECTYYLQTRAAQGFTVIQAVVLAEMDGVHKLSALGLVPFESDDPKRPNEAYFQRVVEVVEEAGRRGLYVALLPTWGDKLTAPWGAGPRLFRNDNQPVARSYAAYLARKVQHCTNVVWMLGGDRPARLDEHFREAAIKYGFPENQDWTPIWNAMAEGITSVWPTQPLLLYHPQGGPISTSVLLRDAKWLSVNGIQSGHGSGRDTPTWELIERDYNIAPPRPVIDLEPNYEDHPVDPWPTWNPANGYFRDYDVRKQLYRSVFAGGCGVTYGHHAVWQFASKRNGVINHADRDWTDAMVRPAAQQVLYLRRLIESRPFFERIPDPSMIVTKYANHFEHSQATRDAKGRYAMIYVPNAGQKITLNLAKLRDGERVGWWFDPRTGIGQRMDADLSMAQVQLQTPTHGPDWVIVIDDASQGFVPPGIVERCHP